jgi:general secretion pathway protein G
MSCDFSLASPAQKGFTLIELIVVIFVLSILIATFLNRVEYYQELAEKTAMEENVGAIQNALNLQHGKHYVRGNVDDLNQVSTENPMKWMQKLPANYAGEYFDPTPTSVAPGNWVFDLKARELIYLPDRTDHFVPGKDGKKWIRFHINIQNEQIKRNGVTGQDTELVGTVFEPVEPVNWF